MSTTVDQRVVEMKFDNRQFESGVRESMSTLDKLKQALNFNKLSTGLESIGKQVSKVDMSGLASATETVTNKFSALEVMAVTALVNITNSAVNAGKALLKNLTIDNLTDGWSKYEKKTEAVQTIMAATRTQFNDTAQQLAVINSKLEELNWFTDETSYNFTDMVSNIGKFTSAGVDLNTATKAMQGIATWAGISGANAVTASRAMYNLAQAIGVGYVKLIDWKTIETCNMSTMEFKQTVLETAVELGTLRKEAEGVYKTVAKGTKVTAEQFSESLSEGWFTNDVLTKSLEVYNKATEKLHEMSDRYNLTATEIIGAFDDYKDGKRSIDEIVSSFEDFHGTAEELIADLDILGSEEYELSLAAFKASQQAKTFTDVIGATKDAVSTGWMQTFEYIFGNYHEAVELFSDLCEVFWELFASGAEARNEMLGLWKAVGGRDTLLKGIYKAFSNIKMVLDAVKNAWDSFFGKETWEKAQGLLNVTHNIEEFFNWMEPTEEELSNITDIFKGLFSILDLLATVLKTILKTVFPMVKPTRSILGIVLDLAAALGRLITNLTGAIKVSIENSTLLNKLGYGLKIFLSIIIYGIACVVKFLSKIDIFGKASKVLTTIVSALAKVFEFLGDAVIFAVKGIITFIYLVKIVALSIVDSFRKLVNSGMNAFAAATTVVKETLIAFLNKLKEIPIVAKVIDKLTEAFGKLKEKLVSLSQNNDKIIAFFEKFKEVVSKVATTVGELVVFLINTIKNLNPVKVLLALFVASLTLAIYRLSKVFNGVPALIESITGVFNVLRRRIKPRVVSVSILKIAASIAILAASLYLIANGIEPDRLWECVAVIAALSGIIIVLTSAAAALSIVLDKVTKRDQGMIRVGAGVLALASSVLVLSYALKILQEVDLESVYKKLGVLGIIAAGLATIAIILAKAAPNMSKDSLMLLAFAISIASMVKSLKVLADLDKNPEELESLVKSLIALMAGLSMLSFAAKNIGMFSAIGLVALVLSLKMILPMLEELATHDYSSIENAIKNNETVFLAIATLASMMTIVGAIFGKNINKFGAGLLMIAAATAILVKVMEAAQELDPAKFEVAILAVTNSILLFGLLAVLSEYTEKAKPIQFAASMVILALAISVFVDISKKMTDIDLKGLAIGHAAILSLLGMVALMEYLSKDATNIAGVSKVLSAISLILVEMVVLSLIDWKELLTSSVAMGITMVAFGSAVYLASQMPWDTSAIKGIIAVAAACAALGLVMNKMAEHRWQRMAAAGAAMAGAIFVLGKTLETMSKMQGFNDTGRCLKKIGAAIAIAASMSVLGLVMSELADNDWISILVATGAMVGVMFAFVKALNFLSTVKNKNLEGYKTIVAISLQLIAIAAAMKILSDYDWKNFGPVLVAVASSLVYLLGITGILKLFEKVKINDDAYKAIFATSTTILAVAVLIDVLSRIKWEDIPESVPAVLAGLGAVAILVMFIMKFAPKLTNGTKKVSKEINPATYKEMLGTTALVVSMCGLLLSAAAAFKIVSDTINTMNPMDVISAFSMIAGFFVAMGVAVKIAQGVKKAYDPQAFEFVFAMAAGLLAIAISLRLLTNIKAEEIWVGLSALLITLYVFKSCIDTLKLTTRAKAGLAAIGIVISIAALLLTFGYTLEKLTSIGWDNVKNVIITIAALLGELYLVCLEIQFLSHVVKDTTAYMGIIAIAALLLSIGYSLSLLNGINFAMISDALAGMVIVVLQMSVVIAEMIAISKWVKNPSGLYGIITICGVLLTISASLMLLTGITWDYVSDGLKAMTVVIVEMFLLVLQMCMITTYVKNPKDLLGIITICGVLYSVGQCLELLSSIPRDKMTVGLAGFSAALLILMSVIAILTVACKTMKGPDIVMLGLGLCAPLIAMALALVILSNITDRNNLVNGMIGLFAVSVYLVAIVAVLSKVGAPAAVSFPLIAAALISLCAGLAVIQLLDWDYIEYGFLKMIAVVGGIAAIGAILAGLAYVLPGAAAAITLAIGVVLAIAAAFAVVALLLSTACNIFAEATIKMSIAMKQIEMVNLDYIAGALPAACAALALLALVMAMFAASAIGNLTLPSVAEALNVLSLISYYNLRSVLDVARTGILGLIAALDEGSMAKVKILEMITICLIELGDSNISNLGTDLMKVALGLTMIFNAIALFNSENGASSGNVNSILVDLIRASDAVIGLADAYEDSAKRILLSNKTILASSTTLGKYLATGLIKGLSDSSSNVTKSAASLGIGLLAAFAASTGINSPSKEMQKMGHYIVEGLTIGVDEEQPQVKRSLNDIGNIAIDTTRGKFDDFKESGKDSIKSQIKGMQEGAEESKDVIGKAEDVIVKSTRKDLVDGYYDNGEAAELAKRKGIVDNVTDTATTIGKADEIILDNENTRWSNGYGVIGANGAVSAAGNFYGQALDMNSVFSAAGAENGDSYYTSLKHAAKSGAEKLGQSFIDVGKDAGLLVNKGVDAVASVLSWADLQLAGAGGDFVWTTSWQDTWNSFYEGSESVDTATQAVNQFADSYKNATNTWQEAEMPMGQTIAYQEAYNKALKEGNTAELVRLENQKDMMVTVSATSQDYLEYKLALGDVVDTEYDAEDVTKALDEALKNLNNNGMSGEQVDEFTQKLQNLHDTIEGQIDAWNEFDRTIDITSEDLIKNLQSQISGVNEWSNKILVLAQRGISKGILEELANMGPQGYKYVEAFIQMTGDELATINDLWTEKGTLSTTSTLAIQAAYALAGDEASKAYVEGLGANLEQIQNAAQQLGDSLAIEATPEALKAIDAYKETFNSLYDSIESSINIFEKFNMETETSSEEMLENMKSQIEGITQWSENLKKLGERGISDGLLKQLSDLGPDGYDKVNAFVEMTDSQLQEANDLYAQSLELPSEATANILSGYAQAGDESAQAFIEALGASVSDVSSIGTNILEGLKLGLFDSEATQNLTTTAYNVGDSIIQQLMLATDSHSPSEEAKKIGRYVDQGLMLGINQQKNMPVIAAKIMGNNMIAGLAGAIEDGSSGVVAAMVNTAMSAIEAAKSVLDINSPSRVFAQIGKYVDEGFAQGIDQNASMVEAPIEKMGNASIDTLKNALTHARDIINGDIDNTITLTPVLDLSNVRAGVQQINGMMNSASVSANATVEGSDESGKNQNGGMTFIQNNYSPKALNRIDIYRQTKNQFTAMKGLVSGT